MRSLSALHLLASDPIDDEQFTAISAGLREAVSTSPGQWIEHGGIWAHFARADRIAAEQDAVLTELFEAARIRLRRRRLRTVLRVLRLELTDFRGVDQLTLALSPNQTTVLVGGNGSGKTTLLDATVLLLSHLAARIARAPKATRELDDEDIMNGRGLARIVATAQIGEHPVTWSIVHARGGDPLPSEEHSNLFSLDEEVAGIHQEIERGDVCLPVAAHYSVNRTVLDIPLRIRTPHLFEPLEAYDGALAGGGGSFRLFFEWFRLREDLENENRIRSADYRDHQLESVRRAVTSLLPGITDLRVQRAPLGLVVTKGEWTLYVNQLSDGEKCLLALVGDLARRLAMANPYADDPLQGGGVVLIDEVELHLYPAWQRRIVPQLEKTFPNCQFIVSTHSPAILGHVDRDSVFILLPETVGIRAVHPDSSRGMDVNRILEDLFEVPERPVEYREKIDRLHELIDAGKTTPARELLSELTVTLGATDPSLVKAEVLLRRREARR